jgi:amidase
LARSARDLRLLLSVIEDGPLAAKAPAAALKSARIALWVEEPRFTFDPEVKAVVEQLGRDLEAAGAEVTPIPCPVDARALMEAYQVLLGATLGEDMPAGVIRQFERLRGVAKLALKRNPDPYSRWALVLAYTATHREWMAADHVRARLRHEIGETFERYDAILAPISPVAAFPHDHRPFDRRRLTLSTGASAPITTMLEWISLATALHLPATTVPAGFTDGGLPVGAQLIGPLGGDARTLALAQAIDDQVRSFTAPAL